MVSDLEPSEYRKILEGKLVCLEEFQKLKTDKVKENKARIEVLRECLALVRSCLSASGPNKQQTILVIEPNDSVDPNKTIRFGEIKENGYTVKVRKGGYPGGRLTMLPQAKPVIAKSGEYKVDVNYGSACYKLNFKKIMAVDALEMAKPNDIISIEQEQQITSNNRKDLKTTICCHSALPNLHSGKNVVTIGGFNDAKLDGQWPVAKVVSPSYFTILTHHVAGIESISKQLQEKTISASVEQIYAGSSSQKTLYHICCDTTQQVVEGASASVPALPTSPGSGTSAVTHNGDNPTDVTHCLAALTHRVAHLELSAVQQSIDLSATMASVDDLSTAVDSLQVDKMLRDTAELTAIAELDMLAGTHGPPLHPPLGGGEGSSVLRGAASGGSNWMDIDGVGHQPAGSGVNDDDDAQEAVTEDELRHELWQVLQQTREWKKLIHMIREIRTPLHCEQQTKTKANRLLYQWEKQRLVERNGSCWKMRLHDGSC